MFDVAQIAQSIGAPFEGDGTIKIAATAEPQMAGSSDLAIAASAAYLAKLSDGSAQAALVAQGTDWQSFGLKAAILVDRPRFAMSALSRQFDSHWRKPTGIHPTALIDESAVIGSGASIGAYTVIAAGVTVGPNAWIGHHVSIAEDVQIGADATIFDGARFGWGVKIGDRCVFHHGAVIGADGFSFVTAEVSTIENVRETLGDQGGAEAQTYAKIHSLGAVRIGDDVDVGANGTIDRGTVRDTVIGNGCKIDNFVHIGHNVVVGDDCLICGKVAIAGSTRVGNNVVLGGQTGVSDNIFIGDGAITGGATKVLSNVPAGRVMLGYPAVKMETQLEMHKALRRLPRFMAAMNEFKKSFSAQDK